MSEEEWRATSRSAAVPLQPQHSRAEGGDLFGHADKGPQRVLNDFMQLIHEEGLNFFAALKRTPGHQVFDKKKSGRKVTQWETAAGDVIERRVIGLNRHGRAVFLLCPKRKLALLERVWEAPHDGKDAKMYEHELFKEGACKKWDAALRQLEEWWAPLRHGGAAPPRSVRAATRK